MCAGGVLGRGVDPHFIMGFSPGQTVREIMKNHRKQPILEVF
jgi:hypothetical protein